MCKIKFLQIFVPFRYHFILMFLAHSPFSILWKFIRFTSSADEANFTFHHLSLWIGRHVIPGKLIQPFKNCITRHRSPSQRSNAESAIRLVFLWWHEVHHHYCCCLLFVGIFKWSTSQGFLAFVQLLNKQEKFDGDNLLDIYQISICILEIECKIKNYY